MNELPSFYFEMGDAPASNLGAGAQSVMVVSERGQEETLAPGTPVLVSEEGAPLSQMEDDLGAICEVFKQASHYFLSIPGVPLHAGDRVIIHYPGGGKAILLRVIEIEDRRARIEPPGSL